MPASTVVGRVVALCRYPVKSMAGEELNAAEVRDTGLLGDRTYGIVDLETGKVASAKNPNKWPDLLQFRAAYVEPPQPGTILPAVRITFPDGSSILSSSPDVDQRLSQFFGRQVSLRGNAPGAPGLEEYWPDIEGLSRRDEVTDEAMPPATFFDCATVHVLSTSTLDQLRALYPDGRFEARRFRPNVMVQLDSGEKGFAENQWVGRQLAIGDHLSLDITMPCPRCVMTTLPQSDLPQDPAILRAAVKHNQATVGVYASVVRGGVIRRGDSVAVQQSIAFGAA